MFKLYVPTKALFGRKVIHEHKTETGRYGKKALIVTGKNSAKACGALADVEEALSGQNIEYRIYDRVENNPSLENVSEGGNEAREFGAEVIIGIGGGSPLDAAKAIAVLAPNRIAATELFRNEFPKKPLPLIAVPTTAGTGSEVTPYSILTRKDIQTKMSFGNDDTFPRLAFLDPRYTDMLPREVTVDTAVDAFSHAAEGFLSKRSTPVTDALATEAIRIFGECLGPLLRNDVDLDVRDKLLYVSMLGGMVIAHTGTTLVHAMGYSLTYFKHIPHGRANGMLLGEYFAFNHGDARDKIDRIISLMGLRSIDEFREIMDRLLNARIALADEEISLYAALTMQQRNIAYNPKAVNEQDVAAFFKRTLT